MMKYVSIRLDDICPTMNWEMFNKVMTVIESYNIKPLLGVVPANADDKLIIDPPKENFFEIIRNYQANGVEIAQHGFDHIYKNSNGGILKLNKRSDMAGLSEEEQRIIIQKGKDILQRNGITTEIYMAPSHSYDTATVHAAKKCGFKYFTDGLTNFNYKWLGIKFIPNLSSYKVSKFGVTTLALHSNTMSDKSLKIFKTTLEDNKDYLVNYSELKTLSCKKYHKLVEIKNKCILRLKKSYFNIIKISNITSKKTK